MVFWVLGPSTRAAYLRVARASGVLQACLRALRQAGMRAKRSLMRTFFFGSCERQSAQDWRAAERRQSRLRRASGLPEPPHDSCCAAAPPQPLWSPPCSSAPPERRPASDPRQHGSAREGIDKSKTQQAAAKETTVTSPPMMVVMAVKLAALCSNESSAGQL